MRGVGTPVRRAPDRNLAALAPACESDDFVAIQRQDACSMTFLPLHDRVLVRRTEAYEKTAGGIIIPDTAKETRYEARRQGKECVSTCKSRSYRQPYKNKSR